MHKPLCMLLFSISILCGCERDTPPARTVAPKTLEGLTAREKFFVTITPEPSPIPFQELFALNVKVTDAQKNPIENVSIDDVRAIMPAHNHGMNVKPEITATGNGTFRVEGMRFHMRGDGEDGLWVLELVINHRGVIDQTSFEVQCCELR